METDKPEFESSLCLCIHNIVRHREKLKHLHLTCFKDSLEVYILWSPKDVKEKRCSVSQIWMVFHVLIWKWVEAQKILQKPPENVSIEHSLEYQWAGKTILCGLLEHFSSPEWFNHLIGCRPLPECICCASATLITFRMCTHLPYSDLFPITWSSQTQVSAPVLVGVPGSLHCWIWRVLGSHTNLPIFPEGLVGWNPPICLLLSSRHSVGPSKASMTSPSFRYHPENVSLVSYPLCGLSLDSPRRPHNVKHHVNADDFQTCSLDAAKRSQISHLQSECLITLPRNVPPF